MIWPFENDTSAVISKLGYFAPGGFSSAELNWRPGGFLGVQLRCTTPWTRNLFNPPQLVLVLAYSRHFALSNSY